MTLVGLRAVRFSVVAAGHICLLRALPLRQVATHQALRSFIDEVRPLALPTPDLEAVLLAMLSVIEPHTGGCRPTLIERYLALQAQQTDRLDRFERCVSEVLRYRGIGNPRVQDAVAIVLDQYADPTLTQETTASAVGMSPAALCGAFFAQTGLHFREYVRNTRLDAAAAMLVETSVSVKEVFARVGYNDRASFNHDFRRRFRCTPTAYRASRIPTPAPLPAGSRYGEIDVQPGPRTSGRVLIVDDDETASDGLARWLSAIGYCINTAQSVRSGLEQVHQICPNAVVVDLHLPDGDGFDFLRQLRSADPGRHINAVIFSADWEVEDRRDDAHALGATVLSKLTDLNEVERIIASLCAMGALLSDRSLAAPA